MPEMIVKLTWDDTKTTSTWMNIDNLKALLYTDTYVKPEFLKVEEITFSPDVEMG